MSFARHLPRAALALARTIPPGFFFVLLSSGALDSSSARRGSMSLERTYRSLGRSQTRRKLATCSQELSKSVARELVSSFMRAFLLTNRQRRLTLSAMSLVFIVRAAACESHDTGFLDCTACGWQKSMERLARLQVYDS